MRGAILLYGLKRLARQNPMQAESAWKALTKTLPFSDEQKYQAEVALVLAWVHQGYPDKMESLRRFRSDPMTRMDELESGEALAGRSGMEWIDAGRADLQGKLALRARSLWRNRQDRPGERAVSLTCRQRSYHGFLAADRLGLPYNLDNTPFRYPKQIDTLAARIGFQRASELSPLAVSPMPEESGVW